MKEGSLTRISSIIPAPATREGRLRLLVRFIGPAKLAKLTNIDSRRWQTVATNYDVKPRLEDLEELLKAFPEYDLWLWRGVSDSDDGQIAPDPKTDS